LVFNKNVLILFLKETNKSLTKTNIMKRILLLIIAFTGFTSQLFSQETYYKLSNGEIVDSERLNSLNRFNDWVLSFNKKGLSLSSLSANVVNTYFAPNDVEIVNAQKKILSNWPTVLVSLSNGQIVKIEINETWDFTETTFAPSSSNESLEETIGDDVYFRTAHEVYVTRDNGQSWDLDMGGLTGASIYDFDIDTNQNVWLVNESGLFKQPLVSNTWTYVDAADMLNPRRVFVDRSQRIWLASPAYGLFYSDDEGAIFTAHTGGYPSNEVIVEMGDDAFNNLYIITAPDYTFSYDDNVGNKVYRSDGGTQSFVRIDQSIESNFVLAGTDRPYTSISGDTILYLGTVGGAYNSLDQGSTWTSSPILWANKAFSLIPTADNVLMVSANSGLYKGNGAGNWTKKYPVGDSVQSGIELFRAANGDIYAQGEVILQSNANSPIYNVRKSTDNGTAWTVDTLGSYATAMDLFFVSSDGVQHAIGAVSETGDVYKVYKKEPGMAWELDMGGLPGTIQVYPWIASLLGQDAQGNIYLFLLNNTTNQTTIYKRAFASNTWIDDGTLSGLNRFVFGITGYNNEVILATLNGVLRKSGNTFVTLPLPSGVGSQLDYDVVGFDNSGKLWAHFSNWTPNGPTGKGVFFTSDFSTWIEPQNQVDTVLFNELVAVGDSMYAISNNFDWVFYFNDDITVGIAEEKTETFTEVFPNPAKNQVTFLFTLNENIDLHLDIMDMTGKNVFSKSYSNLPAGKQYRTIDVNNLAQGMYSWKINAGNKVSTGKLEITR